LIGNPGYTKTTNGGTGWKAFQQRDSKRKICSFYGNENQRHESRGVSDKGAERRSLVGVMKRMRIELQPLYMQSPSVRRFPDCSRSYTMLALPTLLQISY